MTVSVSANIHFNEDDVWHRWHPGDDLCHAYGALKFGEGATLFFDRPAQIDKVIAELVALRAEMDPPAGDEDDPASPDAAEALTAAIGNQNMTNKECIARVSHAGDEAAAVSA